MYSLNEVQSTLRKAIIGAGFDTGIAEDISRAGTLLCNQGFKGADLVLKAIESDLVEPDITIEDTVFTFKDVCVLSCGPSIIDVLISQSVINSSESKVHLQAVDSPLLMLALAAHAATESSINIKFCFLEDEPILVSPIGFELTDRVLKSRCNVTLICSKVESFKEIQNTKKAREAAIAISKKTWQALGAFAAKTYVPATEASRLAGAGAGLTDND